MRPDSEAVVRRKGAQFERRLINDKTAGFDWTMCHILLPTLISRPNCTVALHKSTMHRRTAFQTHDTDGRKTIYVGSNSFRFSLKLKSAHSIPATSLCGRKVFIHKRRSCAVQVISSKVLRCFSVWTLYWPGSLSCKNLRCICIFYRLAPNVTASLMCLGLLCAFILVV